jgi:hypothetical protein
MERANVQRRGLCRNGLAGIATYPRRTGPEGHGDLSGPCGTFVVASDCSAKGNSGESAMSEIVPREDKQAPMGRPLLLAVAAACVLFASKSEGFANNGPAFRGGLWKFERTLETNGKPTDRRQTSGLLIERQIIRCVNPTHALQSEFTPIEGGFCSTRDIRKTNEGYAFEKVCAGTAPIKTEIDVKSDSAYTEINQGNTGKISSKETLVAQRVGDCHRKQ